MNISKTLARLRKENGLKQPEVARYMSERLGKPCAAQSVSHWENGVAMPSGEQLIFLCELYAIRDIQAAFQGINIESSVFGRLNALGKSRAKEYIAMLCGNPLFAGIGNDHGDFVKSGRLIKLYDIPAAAGTGSFLDSYSYEDFEADETVPSEADFAIRVSGESMTPRFVDGQVAFVREQQTLEVGEIGVFCLDGDSYIKKLGHGELLSLNPSYGPIKIQENSSLYVFGKVLG